MRFIIHDALDPTMVARGLSEATIDYILLAMHNVVSFASEDEEVPVGSEGTLQVVLVYDADGEFALKKVFANERYGLIKKTWEKLIRIGWVEPLAVVEAEVEPEAPRRATRAARATRGPTSAPDQKVDGASHDWMPSDPGSVNKPNQIGLCSCGWGDPKKTTRQGYKIHAGQMKKKAAAASKEEEVEFLDESEIAHNRSLVQGGTERRAPRGPRPPEKGAGARRIKTALEGGASEKESLGDKLGLKTKGGMTDPGEEKAT